MKHIVFASALALAACSSGGGDDAGPPPAPVPSAANTAPALTITISASSVDEGQPITIDASATTDSDSDPLTYSLELDDPTLATLTGSNTGPVWVLKTSTVDTAASFTAKVSVSDGSETVSEDVALSIRNFSRTPINTDWGPRNDAYEISETSSAKLAEPRFQDGFYFGSFKTLHALRTTPAGALEVLEFDFLNSQFDPPKSFMLDAPASADSNLVTADFQYPGDLPGFATYSAKTSTAHIYRRDGRYEISAAGEFSIPGLCTAHWEYMDTGGGITLLRSLLVGTENGLWAWLNDGRTIQTRDHSGSFSETQVWDSSRRYCHRARGNVYYDDQSGDFHFAITGSVADSKLPRPLSFPPPRDLTFVDIEIGKDQSGEEFVVLLFAGDTHTSDHQLVILSHDTNGVMDADVIALPNGIPTDLVVTSIDTDARDLARGGDGNTDSDIVIAVPETPYVYVIRSEQPDQDGLSFDPIEFFEVGFGVHDITIAVTDGNNREDLITNDGRVLQLFSSTVENRPTP